MKEKISMIFDKGKCVSLNSMSYGILIAVLLFSILTFLETKRIASRFLEMQESSKDYESARDDIDTLMRASDYLTEEVRLFIITGKRRFMDNYFTEANILKNRDNAVKNILKNLELSDETKNSLQHALNESNNLMNEEFHAMKITAYLNNIDENSLPDEVKNWKLTDEELSLSHEELKEESYNLVFGEIYVAYKDKIRNASKESLLFVEHTTHEKFADSSIRLRNIITLHVILTILLLIFATLLFFLIFIFVVRPLKLYNANIAKDEPLHVTGSKEFRHLAETYNAIFAQNIERQEHLSFIAEHDGLTKLYNRSAFSKIVEQMENQDLNICLLIIDVDKFKEINDTYGHAIGDQALAKTAKYLRQTFRSGDYSVRYGGDEFVVLITDIMEENRSSLVRKLASIFEKLQNPEDDFPKISLSVGLAFSEKGYSLNLLKQADIALYNTKEKGRGGYTFFEEGKLEYNKF